MRWFATRLPDAGVRLLPTLADEVGDFGEATAVVAIEPAGGSSEARSGLEQLAVDVELRLIRGPVPDANRPGAAVAGEWQ